MKKFARIAWCAQTIFNITSLTNDTRNFSRENYFQLLNVITITTRFWKNLYYSLLLEKFFFVIIYILQLSNLKYVIYFVKISISNKNFKKIEIQTEILQELNLAESRIYNNVMVRRTAGSSRNSLTYQS